MPLKTDYKNFIPSTTTKIHDIKQASDGTVINADVILEDVTNYSQEGDVFGSADINATNAQVNANTDAIDVHKAEDVTQEDVIQTTEVNDTSKVPSSAVTFGLQQAFNNHLTDYVKHLTSGIIGSNDDFNNYVENGVYSVGVATNMVNHPSLGDYYGIIVFKNSYGYVFQVAYKPDNLAVKVRARTASIWTAWKSVTLT